MERLLAGVYEHLVTTTLERRLTELTPDLVQLSSLEPADAHEALTRHIAELASRALRAVGGADQAGIARQVEVANSIVKAIGALVPTPGLDDDGIAEPAQTLLAVAEPSGMPVPTTFPERPAVPLTTSALLVNGRGQPRVGHEINRELASADRVDLLCAFIK